MFDINNEETLGYHPSSSELKVVWLNWADFVGQECIRL